MSIITLPTGTQNVELKIPPGKLVQGKRASIPSPLNDLHQAVAFSLEEPVEFPSLRKALTPDDHLTIVVHEEVSGLATVMEEVLKHIHSAGIRMEQITVLVPPRPSEAESRWASLLPAALQGFQLEVHDEASSKMAYLASTREGRRIYLNRHIVDADQLIIVGNVRFDPIFGVATGLAEVFPTMSDQATRGELARHFHESLPSAKHPFPIWKEIDAVAWELGMPFVVCVLEGARDSVCQVISGNEAAVRAKAESWLRDTYLVQVPYQVDLVIGSISGSPVDQTFSQVCQAAFRASRVVHQGGNVAVLSEAGKLLPPGAEVVSQADTAVAGLTFLRDHPQIDRVPWWYLANALEQTKVYLASHLQQEVVESLFMVPFDNANQVQRLIDQARSIVVVESADRTHLQITKSAV